MTDKRKAPASTKPEPTPFERMTDLTRRLIQVPKADVVKPKKALRKHR